VTHKTHKTDRRRVTREHRPQANCMGTAVGQHCDNQMCMCLKCISRHISISPQNLQHHGCRLRGGGHPPLKCYSCGKLGTYCKVYVGIRGKSCGGDDLGGQGEGFLWREVPNESLPHWRTTKQCFLKPKPNCIRVIYYVSKFISKL